MVVGSPHHLFNFLLSYCVHFSLKKHAYYRVFCNMHTLWNTIWSCFTNTWPHIILLSLCDGNTESFCNLKSMLFTPPSHCTVQYQEFIFWAISIPRFSAQLLSALTLVSYEIFYVVTWYHAVFIWLNLARFMWHKLCWFIHVTANDCASSFIKLSLTPLCMWTTLLLSIHLLICAEVESVC